MNERIERLNTMVDEGRVIRNAWTGLDEQGRETACLLAALSPEAGEAEDAEACPASVMPTWFANLTPWIDDEASDTEWHRTVHRYAACAARWSTLDNAAWRRVEIASRRASVVEAMSHTIDERVLNVSRVVLVWLDEDMPEQPRDALWETVVAVRASRAEVSAAVSLVVAKMSGEAAVARAAARAADAAAWAARRSFWEVADVVVREAKAEAADRITDAVLTALEKECGLNQKEEA
jgi:hypothetical protein